MTKKIANAIILVSVISLVLSFILSFSFINNYFNNKQQNKLIDELSVITILIEKNGLEELKKSKFEDYQITIINKDGKIIFDSLDEDRIGENEPIENYKIGNGYEIVNSYYETKTYSTKQLADGSFVRIMSKQFTPIILIIGIIQPIIFFLIIIVCLSIYLAKRLSKNIVAPLKDLDLENPLRNNVYDELTPLLKQLNSHKEELKLRVAELYRKNLEILHITENIDEAILILDSTGKILSINKKAQDLLGVGINEYYLENFFDYNYSEVIKKALAGESNSGKFYKDKNIYKITAQVSKLKNDELAVFVIFDNITDEETNAQFRREFSANVSHELKTPLSSIMGMSELIAEGLVEKKDIAAFAKKINKESKRLLNLIQDIIKLSRLDEGNLSEQVDLIDLKEELLTILNSLEYKALEKNITITKQIDNCKIRGIKPLIFDALRNLIDNAINYNVESGNIDIILREINDTVEFSVEDTGIGIADKDITRIFERFYRVDKSHSKLTGGTGLGLAIVKNVALLHDAKIEISSQVNKGTKITLKFKNI